MKGAGISAQRGYKRRSSYKSSEISMDAENHLNRIFLVTKSKIIADIVKTSNLILIDDSKSGNRVRDQFLTY